MSTADGTFTLPHFRTDAAARRYLLRAHVRGLLNDEDFRAEWIKLNAKRDRLTALVLVAGVGGLILEALAVLGGFVGFYVLVAAVF